jgi:hypothetical protein
MDASREKNERLYSSFLEELESPFVSELDLPGKTSDEYRPDLTLFEQESPFVRAFSSLEGVQRQTRVPQSSQTEAEQIYEDQSESAAASTNLMADAFVIDKDGQNYLSTFPQLGDLTVKKVTILTPSNFENLMDQMLASTQKNFVIDAHGDPNGLHMPLANKAKGSATKQSLFMLQGIERIRFLMRNAEAQNNFWGRASGADLESWRRIVEIIHNKTWQRMAGSSWPTTTPPVASVDEAKRIVQSLMNAIVNSLFPTGVSDRSGRVDRLIKKMLQLQARGILQIQFRACNIGKDFESLHQFRTFFGAAHLCAPDVRSGMGYTFVKIDKKAVDTLEAKSETQLFQLAAGRFAIRIIISGTSFRADAAADTQQAVLQWIAAHIMENSKYRSGKLPIHFIQTRPLAFPIDKEYAAHIQCRSSFWEGVLRANELEEQEA